MTAPPPKRRRRARRPDRPLPPAPLWKRLLACASFTLGGGGLALWGIFALAGWIGALQAGRPTIETESVVFGLIPLGLGIGAIGALFFLPAATTAAGRTWQERIAIGLLGLMAAGLLMAMLGGFVVSAVMEGQGYRRCEVRHGRRVTFIDWAARGAPCPVPYSER